MTLIRKRGNKRALCCDEPGCRETYGAPFTLTALKATVASARMHGWHVIKTPAGNWQHYCPKHDDKGGDRDKHPAPLPAGPAEPRDKELVDAGEGDGRRFYWQDH
jgi:hypothetical protein